MSPNHNTVIHTEHARCYEPTTTHKPTVRKCKQDTKYKKRPDGAVCAKRVLKVCIVRGGAGRPFLSGISLSPWAIIIIMWIGKALRVIQLLFLIAISE